MTQRTSLVRRRRHHRRREPGWTVKVVDTASLVAPTVSSGDGGIKMRSVPARQARRFWVLEPEGGGQPLGDGVMEMRSGNARTAQIPALLRQDWNRYERGSADGTRRKPPVGDKLLLDVQQVRDESPGILEGLDAFRSVGVVDDERVAAARGEPANLEIDLG